MAQLAAADGSHVIDIDIHVDDRADLTDQLAAAANHCHAIDVNVDRTAEPHECAVCMERLKWVAVGPCGHRDVCSKCTVRIRTVDGNRLCCICRTPCPAVVVTRRSRAGDEKNMYAKLPSSSLAAADEGRVGTYWYHMASAAYFDDERQYNAARRACSELERAEVGDEDESDDPDAEAAVVIFIFYEAISFLGGSIMCSGYATEHHHWSLKLAVLLGGGFGFAAMTCVFWFLMDWLHHRDRRRRQ